MAGTGGNRRAVEAVLNHLHVADLFGAEGPGLAARPELTAEQAVYLGRLLREMWAAKLARDFPGRRFTVTFPDDEREDVTEYEVTFFQEHERTIGT
ncbi:hypothetical protein [Limnoglobus roseus]|uniref:Uncharacterized protein n=1 Tax=Limnoglobus roseus TaxID=2598579 RepID=A0A5C1ABM4_9BACT|nr:hypothetical protein [Limnoglobus roseus]QEL15597.1 hypothetical protein PX52LOC_02529 [Limnoglobus roseus]